MCSSNWLRYTNTQYPAEQIYSTRLFNRQFCTLCAHNPSCTFTCLALRSKVQRNCVHAKAAVSPRPQSEARWALRLGAAVHSMHLSTHSTNWSRLVSYSITLSGLLKVFSQKTKKQNKMLFVIFHDPRVLCRNMFLSFYQCLYLLLLSWLRQDIKLCKTRVELTQNVGDDNLNVSISDQGKC